MLCDTILAAGYLPRLYPGFEREQALLRSAHKFVLGPDFTAASDGLVDNRAELLRAAPFCRLPFPVCWFEFAQADRPHFVDAETHFPEVQRPVRRAGFLCVALDPARLSCWLTFQFWTLVSFDTNEANASIVAIIFDTQRAFTDTGDELARHIKIATARYCPPAYDQLLRGKNQLFNKMMQSDWGGEIRFLFAMLGLLNARNVVETEPVDKTEHNRKRERQKQPPLCSHTLLKIRAQHKPSLVPGRHAERGELRAHFVRGHFKTRRTGIFWWGPHMRGNREHGIVTHDYEVHT